MFRTLRAMPVAALAALTISTAEATDPVKPAVGCQLFDTGRV